MRKVLIISDTHCGHRYGLAVPQDCSNRIQRKAWSFFQEGIKKLGPFDIVFLNGDAIDGNARKNGGVELITTDRIQQCDFAERILRAIADFGGNQPKYYFTKGTPYHTGHEEDWEEVLASRFRDGQYVNIKNHFILDVDGVRFDFKHKVGRGTLPHSSATPLLRDVLMTVLKEHIENREKVNVVIRSHVHYHVMVQAMQKTAFTTPALQVNSNYGELQCSGLTDFGFLVAEVDNGSLHSLQKWINPTPLLVEHVTKV
jgi:hypothetical protein